MIRATFLLPLACGLAALALASVAVRGCGGEHPAKGPAPLLPPDVLAELLDYTPAEDLLDPYPGGPSYALAAADTLVTALAPALVSLGDTPAACAALRILDGAEDVAMDVHLDPAMKAGARLRGRDVLLRALDAKGAVLRAMEPAPCAMLR